MTGTGFPIPRAQREGGELEEIGLRPQDRRGVARDEGGLAVAF